MKGRSQGVRGDNVRPELGGPQPPSWTISCFNRPRSRERGKLLKMFYSSFSKAAFGDDTLKVNQVRFGFLAHGSNSTISYRPYGSRRADCAACEFDDY